VTDCIDELIANHNRYILLLGEQLAFLKQDWDQAFGEGLNPTQKKRRWAAFLREHWFINPNHLSPVEWITPDIADRLIAGFQAHLLAQHLGKQAKA